MITKPEILYQQLQTVRYHHPGHRIATFSLVRHLILNTAKHEGMTWQGKYF